MTLILTQPQVRELLPMDKCIDLMADALVTLDRGDGVNPLRTGMFTPDRKGLLGTMPGYLGEPASLGLKVITVFEGNHGTPYDSHQGIVLLFELENGRPLVILDASEVTAIRTAAVSGLATRLLAKEGAGDLALIGSGVQARTHLEAVRAVCNVRRVRVFSPTQKHREEFAAVESQRHGLTVEAVDSARAAVEGADVICTVTSAREPVVCGDWIAPGAHINAAGSAIPKARELDTAAVVRSRLFTDRLESILAEAGDFLLPRQEGAIGDDHIVGELGQILSGELPGRTDEDEVTCFKSLGIAVEDLASAHYVYNRAKELGVGTEVELGGLKHAPV